jgi:hypothetical protein
MLFPLLEELRKETFLSGRSLNEVLKIVAFQNPEINFTPEEWKGLDGETKSSIINRIGRTLNSLR